MHTTDAFLAALALLLIPAALSDVMRQRMPPAIPAAIGALGWLRTAVAVGPAAVAACLAQAAGLGALLGGVILLFRRLRPNTATLGWGDAGLLVAASTWVGISGCVLILLIASLVLCLAALARAPWQGLDLKRQRPFAPGLALGLAVVLALTRWQHP